MGYAKDTKKDTTYTSVNQLIQPKKGNGKSIMPPYHASLQAKSGGANDESAPKQTNPNLKQVYQALPPDLKMLISLAELESGFGAGFLESARQKTSREDFESLFKELSQPLNLIQFYLGSKVGMSLGALKDLRDNITGLWEFVKLGFKYSPAMQLYEWTFDTKNKIKQTQENIKQATEFIEGIYQFGRELNQNPTFLQEVGKKLGVLAGQESAKWFTDKFIEMPSFDKGKTVGEVAGYIVMEIVLFVVAPEELAAKGAAWAGKVSGSSELVAKVIELLARIPGLKKILTARGYLKGGEAAVETEKIAAVSAKAISLTGKDANLAAAALRIKPIKGYTDVVIHGTATEFQVLHNGKWVSLDQRALAKYLQKSGYSGKESIRLISCSTGELPNGVAQNLSNKLGVEVIAPSDTVWIHPDGSLTIGPKSTSHTGTWNSFSPRKVESAEKKVLIESEREAAAVKEVDEARAVAAGKKTQITSEVTVLYRGKEVSIYRGGSDFTIKPNEIKIDKVTGLMKDTHGISLDVDPTTLTKFGGAYKIDSLPEGLKIIQRGVRVEHFEIVPTRPMTLNEFQKLLNQIKTSLKK